MRNPPYPHSAPASAPDSAATRGSGAQASNAQAVNTHIRRAISRLLEVLDQETAALRDRTPIDLKDSNNRKAHGLLELDRAAAMLEGMPPDGATLALLRELREKLDTNSRVLGIHIDAVREIASIIAESIREAESDGTYTPACRGKGPAP